MGHVQLKSLELASEIQFKGTASDTYAHKISLNGNPSADTTYYLPSDSTGATILTDESDLNATKLDISQASSGSVADTDSLLARDSTGANVRYTISALKTDFGAAPSAGSSGNIQVSDGTDYQSVAVSGDASLSSAGALTLADKPSSAGTAEASKYLKTDSNNEIASLDKLSATTLQADTEVLFAETNSKLWKISVNASGNLVFSCSSDSGSSFTNANVINAP